MLNKQPGQLHSNSIPASYQAITCKSLKSPASSSSALVLVPSAHIPVYLLTFTVSLLFNCS